MDIHILESDTIAQNVARKLIGNYWLGDFSSDGSLYVRYIGRSDTCLRRRLKEHSGKAKYEAFVFRESEQIKEAFDIECREWHMLNSLGQLDNQIHPDSPSKLPYKCAYCKTINHSTAAKDSFVGGEA